VLSELSQVSKSFIHVKVTSLNSTLVWLIRSGNRIKKYKGRSHLQSEIDSKIVLAPRFGAITKADPLEVDPTVK
jgi:hypothetical protein